MCQRRNLDFLGAQSDIECKITSRLSQSAGISVLYQSFSRTELVRFWSLTTCCIQVNDNFAGLETTAGACVSEYFHGLPYLEIAEFPLLANGRVIVH